MRIPESTPPREERCAPCPSGTIRESGRERGNEIASCLIAPFAYIDAMNLKVGIVGFGKMGMLHGALLNPMDEVEITAVADTSRIILDAFKKFLPNTRFYTSHKKMFEQCELNAAIIATPSFSHVPVALDAIAKNVDVFIEKPLTNTFESASALFNAARERSVVSMVGFCLREAPSFQKGRSLLSAGAVGKIENVKAEMYIADVLAPQKGWRYKKRISGGGVLIDFGIHVLDLLFWYLGPVASVSATARRIHSEEVEDAVEGEIEFRSGVTARVTTSWSNPDFRKSYSRIEITGETGVLTVTDQTVHVTNRRTGTEERLTFPDLYEGYHIDIGGPLYSTQMVKFIDAVRTRTNPESDIESAYHVQQIVDAMYRSANKLEKIAL
jgi:predicted dehydrogenase